MLTRFEKARIIGARALQLSMGAPPLVKVEGVEDPLKLAEIEFEEGLIPLIVVRHYPDGRIEKIRV